MEKGAYCASMISLFEESLRSSGRAQHTDAHAGQFNHSIQESLQDPR